jgi:hypothetical protein
MKGDVFMPRLHQSVETEVINGETGELITKKTNRTLSWGNEPAYVKLYLDNILYLSDMPTKHASVLYALLKRASYAGEEEGMQVIVNASLKRRIQESLGFKNISSINNAITDLTKGNIIYRVDVGIYNFNPHLFGKGEWQDIARLRLEVDYDLIKGKTFKAVCEYKDHQSIQNDSEGFDQDQIVFEDVFSTRRKG